MQNVYFISLWKSIVASIPNWWYLETMPGHFLKHLMIFYWNLYLILRQNLSVLLDKFNFLRRIYRSNNPKKRLPFRGPMYKVCAVETGQLLLTKFEYAHWPNYLHKIIEQIQQLIEDPSGPSAIGSFSSERNEAGNKLSTFPEKTCPDVVAHMEVYVMYLNCPAFIQARLLLNWLKKNIRKISVLCASRVVAIE